MRPMFFVSNFTSIHLTCLNNHILMRVLMAFLFIFLLVIAKISPRSCEILPLVKCHSLRHRTICFFFFHLILHTYQLYIFNLSSKLLFCFSKINCFLSTTFTEERISWKYRTFSYHFVIFSKCENIPRLNYLGKSFLSVTLLR